MNFESYYRKLTPKELKKNPRYKYELVKIYTFWEVDLGPWDLYIDGYVFYHAPPEKSLTLYLDYRWDGSTVVFDTKYCMRASAGHDAICQLIKEGKLDPSYRKYADQLYRDWMIEDGAWKWWVGLRYTGLRLWANTGLRIKAVWDRMWK